MTSEANSFGAERRGRETEGKTGAAARPFAAALLFKRHKWKDEHLILILTNGQETKTKYLLEFGLKKEYAENEDVSRQGKPRLVLKED
jgi:hypothetical protein